MSEQAVPVEWEIILSTFERVEEWWTRWATEGQILPSQRDELVRLLHERIEQAKTLAGQGVDPPSIPGMLPRQPEEVPPVRAYRLWRFLDAEVSQHKTAGRLTLSQAHALEGECRERMTSLKRRLIQDGVTLVMSPPNLASASRKSETDSGARKFLDDLAQLGSGEAAQASSTSDSNATEPITTLNVDESKPRRNILELLLDPRSIQWLMGLGGALMVVGLVILLWVNKYFTPPVLAMVMGGANVAVLLTGWGLIQKTRYQLVGRGLTLLSCLVMPLNLWYYHTQNLVTIDGHLWVAAVVVSALYGASAWILKDEMFVYVFSAGVAMTGLLILADMPPSPQKFWEIASPATLLMLLGLAGIHAERAFGENDGPFSRKRFGLAFFASGHVLMAAGLLMVFGAQISGDWLYEAWFKPVFDSFQTDPSPICGPLRWLALVLVLAATYAYIYSDIVVRKHGAYFHFAAFTLLWAEVLIVQLLHLKLGVDEIITILAGTSLAVNLAQATVTRDQKLTRAFPVFGLLLSLLPVLLGLSEYFHYLGFRAVWVGKDPRWTYVGAMALTAVASRVGAYIYRDSAKWLPTAYHFATAAASMVGAVAALAAMGLETWQEHAPIMMLIPIAYLVAAKLYGDRGPSEPLTWVAHTATVVMLISSMSSAFAGFTKIVEGQTLNLSLAAFFAEAAVFYGLASAFQRQARCIHFATIMACGSLWQLMTYFGFSADAYLLTFAGIGLLLLIAYRFSMLEQTAAAPLTEAAFKAANSLLSVAFVSSVFRGLGRLISDAMTGTDKVQLGFVGFSVTMLVIAMLAVAIVKVSSWRRWYVVQVVAQGALTLLALHKLIDLSPWQQVELFSVIVGLLLLAVGHLGWYREQDRESDLVSMSLFFGSLLAAVPLAIATWIDRHQGHFLIANEAGFLFVSVLLLGTGLVFQLKSTTLVGSLSTALYFITLLLLVEWNHVNTVAKLITIGGGTLFGGGLILAFFRDRLLALPERIKNREGIFKVMNWR